MITPYWQCLIVSAFSSAMWECVCRQCWTSRDMAEAAFPSKYLSVCRSTVDWVLWERVHNLFECLTAVPPTPSDCLSIASSSKTFLQSNESSQSVGVSTGHISIVHFSRSYVCVPMVFCVCGCVCMMQGILNQHISVRHCLLINTILTILIRNSKEATQMFSVLLITVDWGGWEQVHLFSH